MKRNYILLAAFLSISLGAAATQPALSIYSGAKDTVYTAEHTIVAVTDPGAVATINGNPVHVYKTGSFGEKVALNPGANKVEIAVSKDGESTNRTLDIYLAEKPKAQPEKAAAPASESLFSTPFYVQSTKGAYLQYGNGDDRLGGSKMGFLAAGIPMKVVAEKGSLYKVQLSTTRFAFIPKEYTEQYTADVTPVVNTSSWSITNEGARDVVCVSLPERRPYHYYTTLDPSTIVVEVYGAFDNSNWITQRTLDLGMVDYVDYNQVESDVYQVIIHLKKKYQWGFSVEYDGNALSIGVRHTPEKLDLKYLTIGLDAGHGGEYPGAISPSGIKEKDVNLDIIQRLRALLEKGGAKVIMTRDDDTSVTMKGRKDIWKEANVDLAISVHNNSGGSALSSPGTSTYYKHLFCRPLAESLITRVVETGLPLFGLVGNFNFSLNGPTEYPNALVEGMFMSSLAEEEKLADPEFRQLFAQKIFQGIVDYIKLVKSEK